MFKKCINISILDFALFPDEEGVYSCFHIREDTRGFIYTDKMEFHLIELPKLPEELGADCSDIELWAKFINSERKEDFAMAAERNPYIASAYECLQIISRDEEKRLKYEAREKAIRDYNQMMLEAREEGEARGEARVIKLVTFLMEDGRFDDLKRSAQDNDFRERLMKEYGI